MKTTSPCLPQGFFNDAVEVLELRRVSCSCCGGIQMLDLADFGVQTLLNVGIVRQQIHEKTVRVGRLYNNSSLLNYLSLKRCLAKLLSCYIIQTTRPNCSVLWQKVYLSLTLSSVVGAVLFGFGKLNITVLCKVKLYSHFLCNCGGFYVL